MSYCQLLVPSALILSIALFENAQPQEGAPAFSAERIRADVKNLSSDRFEGRGIGTLGEERTIDYIASAFKKAGLQPAGERGTYFQTVPLVGVTTGKSATLAAAKGKEVIDFAL